MRRDGQQHMEFAAQIAKIKQKEKTPEEYSREFVKEKTIRTSSIVWFGTIISALIIVLAFASSSYFFLLALPFAWLAPLLLNWRMKTKLKKEQEFMKQHFMKQGDPRYWGRGTEEEN